MRLPSQIESVDPILGIPVRQHRAAASQCLLRATGTQPGLDFKRDVDVASPPRGPGGGVSLWGRQRLRSCSPAKMRNQWGFRALDIPPCPRHLRRPDSSVGLRPSGTDLRILCIDPAVETVLHCDTLAGYRASRHVGRTMSPGDEQRLARGAQRPVTQDRPHPTIFGGLRTCLRDKRVLPCGRGIAIMADLRCQELVDGGVWVGVACQWVKVPEATSQPT
jgi:hypothetical protein